MKQDFTTTIRYEEAQLLIFELTESIDELYKQLDFVNIEEFSKIVSEKRKKEYLAVRVAMKKLLVSEKIIIYDPDGKPALSDGSLQISISHSANWIAVIAHPTRSVGIDIEVPTEKMKKLYKRFLSETEQKELSNGEHLNLLMLAWSAKEALYKIIGMEAVDFAKQLRIYPFEVKETGTFTGEHIPTKNQYKIQYFQNQDFVLTYCISK